MNKSEQQTTPDSSPRPQETLTVLYRIQFREEEQVFSAPSRLPRLPKGIVVMVQTDHGLEPGRIVGSTPNWPDNHERTKKMNHTIIRRATRDEEAKYAKLKGMEDRAFAFCAGQIEKNKLPMRLVKVERFFSGSKIIFYFTAENRVDFRELVKILVQEFRTRVEMRQIGVRHETMMLGGVGCCGRELCCSSFIKNFESVSIKMAKEQNLPLNPVKISGACNRLLCCLNYEFATYKAIRKNMPKVGKRISYDNQNYKVIRHNVMSETITLLGQDGKDRILIKEEWLTIKPAPAAKKSQNDPQQERPKSNSRKEKA